MDFLPDTATLKEWKAPVSDSSSRTDAPCPMLLFLSPNSLSLLTLFELCDKHIAADLGTDSCIEPISNMPGKLTLKKTSRGQLPHSIKNTATNGLLVYKYN